MNTITVNTTPHSIKEVFAWLDQHNINYQYSYGNIDIPELVSVNFQVEDTDYNRFNLVAQTYSQNPLG